MYQLVDHMYDRLFYICYVVFHNYILFLYFKGIRILLLPSLIYCIIGYLYIISNIIFFAPTGLAYSIGTDIFYYQLGSDSYFTFVYLNISIARKWFGNSFYCYLTGYDRFIFSILSEINGGEIIYFTFPSDAWELLGVPKTMAIEMLLHQRLFKLKTLNRNRNGYVAC